MAAMAASARGLATHKKPQQVVIAGGGVIGCATAYYLAKEHGVGATIVDRKSIAAAASGNAGGFLARDWNDGSPTQEMTHRSFDLHATLAEDLKKYGATDYRRLTCVAVGVDGRTAVQKPGGKKLESVDWADSAGVMGMRPMGNEDTIAQVHPRKLCDAFVAAAKDLAGASVVEGCASGLREEDGRVTGLELSDGSTIEADAVVLCMGPWSHALGRPKNEKMGLRGDEDYSGWGLPHCPLVVGTKYHAVLLQSPRVLSQSVFFQGLGDPEVYPRPDGEVYVTGSPDPADIVRDLPGETEVREEVCEQLVAKMNVLSSELKGAPINRKQACHLPSAVDGVPVVGELRSGTYVGYGHGCWGILLAPATGEALANQIATGASPTLDLGRFDPRRF